MSTKKKKQEDYNIFVGGKTGAFKGIKIDNNGSIVKNLRKVEILTRDSEISILNWSDSSQSEILIGTIGQEVKIFDVEFKAYNTSLNAKYGTGPIVGLSKLNGSVITCSSSGHIKIWANKKSEELELPTGAEVSKMRVFNNNKNIIALGGNKNDLKIWDLKTKTKIFCAKNVKKDMLELEVPVWLSDLTFLPDTEYKIAVSTKYGQIRLYDTKAQRRPVIDINVKDQSFNTICLSNNNNQVIVGSATGHLMSVDLRQKGKILHYYKGPVGSVRQVTAHPDLPYFTSVGLDRYVRVYHIEKRKLFYEQYLKVRLNCALITSDFGKGVEYEAYQLAEKNDDDDDDDDDDEYKNSENNNEFNEIFNNMERICDKRKKKKLKIS